MVRTKPRRQNAGWAPHARSRITSHQSLLTSPAVERIVDPDASKESSLPLSCRRALDGLLTAFIVRFEDGLLHIQLSMRQSRTSSMFLQLMKPKKFSIDGVCERECVCCLLVLNSVTSTPQWIRQPEAAWFAFFSNSCYLVKPRWMSSSLWQPTDL